MIFFLFSSLVFKTRQSVLGRPERYITPYGGQLVWRTVANKQIFVHLKDKTRVRNRKRWSQIMYLYYLLTKKTSLKMKPTTESNKTDLHKPFLSLLEPDCLRQVSAKPKRECQTIALVFFQTHSTSTIHSTLLLIYLTFRCRIRLS